MNSYKKPSIDVIETFANENISATVITDAEGTLQSSNYFGPENSKW